MPPQKKSNPFALLILIGLLLFALAFIVEGQVSQPSSMPEPSSRSAILPDCEAPDPDPIAYQKSN